MITETDYYNIIETARQDGLAAGLAQGEEKGIEKGRMEGFEKGRIEGIEKEKSMIAKALVQEGIPIATIASATGLSEEEITAL